MKTQIASATQLSAHKRSILKKSWRWLSLVLLSLMLGGILMGCQVDQQALQRDPFMRDMMQLQQQQDQPHKFGQTFDVGNTRWKISAAHAALTLRLGAQVIQAQGKFVVIDFTFTNTTDQPQHPTADMLLLQDSSGNVSYKSDAQNTSLLSTWQQTANFLKDVFQPNHPYDCSVVFDVPIKASNLSLNFQSFPTQAGAPDM
jgi:hypothetical protein